MNKIWQQESLPILLTGFALLITGLVTQLWLPMTVLFLVGYIIWLYRRVSRLERWIERGFKSSEVYDDQGVFGDIIRHLYLQRKVHNKRKKRTKEILRRLNRNISALPDATVLLNDQLEIEWSNAPAQYLLGINQRRDAGNRISNLFRHPDFLRYLISPDQKDYLEIESPLDKSTTIRMKIVRFGSDQRLLIAQNVTDHKQLQEALKNFVANASHELKTPLTTISGHLEMLESESKLSQGGRKSIQVAMKQATRMKTLIENLLLLSQLESYVLQPNEGSLIDINQLMAQILSSFSVGENESQLRYHAPADLYLRGIKPEIESICSNLIDNAIKYSNLDQAPVEVSWSINANGESVFSVKDHGAGISANELPHLTERYYRGQEATQDQVPGSGLGLAIVEQAALKHGAKLKIESARNKGSRFSVVFPQYRIVSSEMELESRAV